MPMPCYKDLFSGKAKQEPRCDTHDDAVGARDGGAAALAARANTDNTDRAAVESEQDVHVLEDNAEEAEQGSTSGRVRLRKYRLLIHSYITGKA